MPSSSPSLSLFFLDKSICFIASLCNSLCSFLTSVFSAPRPGFVHLMLLLSLLPCLPVDSHVFQLSSCSHFFLAAPTYSSLIIFRAFQQSRFIQQLSLTCVFLAIGNGSSFSVMSHRRASVTSHRSLDPCLHIILGRSSSYCLARWV